jgi:hypothetical protein
MSQLPLHGGCLCGAIRYELDAPPGGAEYCHCAMCRKASGSAFSANAVVPASALRVVSGLDSLKEYASSGNRRKCFCGNCGSQLFIRRGGDAQVVVVTLGSLDAGFVDAPRRHVFVGSKAAWHRIDGDLPQYAVYPGCEPSGG